MKGFTLIELLVVVLIIGILATIALPQYELVVEKSRATEAMVNAKAIQDACQRHNQEFPDDVCDDKSKIADVQLKGGNWQENGNCFLTKNFSYDIGTSVGTGPEDRRIEVCRKNSPTICSEDNALYCVTFRALPSSSSNRITYTYNCDGDYAQVCKLFTSL